MSIFGAKRPQTFIERRESLRKITIPPPTSSPTLTMPAAVVGGGGNGRITCVVLGGLGFVGRYLVARLLHSHDWFVRIADSYPSDRLHRHPTLADAVRAGRAAYVFVDVRDAPQLRRVIGGSSVVFYIGPENSNTSHDFYSQYMLVVQGAKNVVRACQECKVERLVYNSSADVVFDGKHSVENGNESLPYPWKFEDTFNELTAQAETVILLSNGSKGVLTCALRPSNPFGPGALLPPVIQNEESSGCAKFIIGSGENMCDFTYVENVAHAHVCAEQALRSSGALLAGKAFFITNNEPVKMWYFFTRILEGLGHERPNVRLPVKLVSFVVMLVNWANEKLKICHSLPLLFNPFIVQALSSTRTFDCSRARKYLGYTPKIKLEDGIALTVESSFHFTMGSSFLRSWNSESSKAYKALGGGKVADTLLWRDEKKTFGCILLLFTLFYWFVLSGRSLVSSSALLVLLLLVTIMVHNKLPSSISQKLAETCLNILGSDDAKTDYRNIELTETATRDFFVSLQLFWNNVVVQTLNILAQGEDVNYFMKVSFTLYLLKCLLPLSTSTLFGLCLMAMFIFFVVYEQHEKQLDGLRVAAVTRMERLIRLFIRRLPIPFKEFLHNNHMLNFDNAGKNTN